MNDLLRNQIAAEFKRGYTMSHIAFCHDMRVLDVESAIREALRQQERAVRAKVSKKN